MQVAYFQARSLFPSNKRKKQKMLLETGSSFIPRLVEVSFARRFLVPLLDGFEFGIAHGGLLDAILRLLYRLTSNLSSAFLFAHSFEFLSCRRSSLLGAMPVAESLMIPNNLP